MALVVTIAFLFLSARAITMWSAPRSGPRWAMVFGHFPMFEGDRRGPARSAIVPALVALGFEASMAYIAVHPEFLPPGGSAVLGLQIAVAFAWTAFFFKLPRQSPVDERETTRAHRWPLPRALRRRMQNSDNPSPLRWRHGEPGPVAGRRAVSRAPTRDLRAPGLRARRPASLDPAVPTAHPVEEAALVRAMTPAPPRTRAGGTRAVWTLLREDGWTVNRRRIERLWRLEGHRLPPRGQKTSGKRAQGRSENSSRNRPGPQAMSPLNV